MKRGKCFLLGALCLALTLTAACTSGAERARDNAEVSLRFLHIWPEHSEVMEAIVRDIEEQNDG